MSEGVVFIVYVERQPTTEVLPLRVWGSISASHVSFFTENSLMKSICNGRPGTITTAGSYKVFHGARPPIPHDLLPSLRP